MSKHTPGPWRVGRGHNGALGVWSNGVSTDSPDVCSVAAVPNTEDEKRARLIAAAPELLEAAEAVEAWWNAMPIMSRVPAHDEALSAIRKARAAIAKAKGETP